MEQIIIFGAGGQAKVLHSIASLTNKYKTFAFISSTNSPSTFCDIQHLPFSHLKSLSITKGIVAIGDNFTRKKVVDQILCIIPDFEFINLIHPRSCIANDVVIGKGVCVMPNAVINASANIGSHTIVNSSCVIEHDCIIQDYSSLAPSATLGGHATVGKVSAISLGAKVNNGVNIGSNTVIGSGSVVIDHIPSNVLAYGVPCKVIRTRECDEKYL